MTRFVTERERKFGKGRVHRNGPPEIKGLNTIVSNKWSQAQHVDTKENRGRKLSHGGFSGSVHEPGPGDRGWG